MSVCFGIGGLGSCVADVMADSDADATPSGGLMALGGDFAGVIRELRYWNEERSDEESFR